MTPTAGAPTRIGAYPIEREIGRGGMGIVYLARDPKLERPVAIKVLPEAFASDPERLTRFEREARLLASLNHPNIAGIYGLEEADGRRFLALEYVEGETLAERLVSGPLAVDEAVDVCRQIATALEAAHESGVVHRDLKPGNVKLTPSGEVKVLDFGLAKAGAGSSSGSSGNLTQSPTVALTATGSNVILGTAAYMSPEQARGRAVDRRTDIWSFGCVLFECLSGRQAFAGETISDMIARILQGEPDWSALPEGLPARLRELLERCLAKDAKKRLRDIGEARLSLEGAFDAPAMASPAAAAQSPASTPWLVYGIAAAFVVSTAVLGWMVLTRAGGLEPTARLAVTPPPGVQVAPEPVFSAISPDGGMIAFIGVDSAGTSSLWLRPVDAIEARELPGTQDALLPFWSPDSRHIAFSTQDKLKKIDIRGGSPEVLCSLRSFGRGGSWGSRDVIVFAAAGEGPLYQVSARGGTPEQVSVLDSAETGHRFPRFLPDGRRFLYASLPSHGGAFDIYVGTLDATGRERLMAADGVPVYVEPGYLLYTRNERLVAHRFDAKSQRLRGDPITLSDEPSGVDWLGSARVSASLRGPLIYVRRPVVSTELVWFDPSGRRQGRVPVPPGRYETVVLSPDGTQAVVVKVASATESDLWIVELERGTMTRFTFGPGRVDSPVWSPDGNRIVFSSNRAGHWDLYEKPVSGAIPEEPLLTGGSLLKYSSDWSMDGRFLLFHQLDEKTGWDIWVLPVEGDRNPTPYLRTPFDESEASFSPDGRWVAYESYESGRGEVYVQAFPTPGRKHQVSSAGGAAPLWRADGRQVLFRVPGGRGAIVDVRSGESFASALPRPTFPLDNVIAGYPTPDFARALVCVLAEEGRVPPTLMAVLGWRAELKRE